MVCLKKIVILAPIALQLVSAAAIPEVQNATATIMRREATATPLNVAAKNDKIVPKDDAPVTTDDAKDDEKKEVTEEIKKDDVEDQGRHRRNKKCRSHMDCDLGHICSIGRCVAGCQADVDCPRGQRCLGYQCRATEVPPVCRPYKAQCSVDQECCSGNCGKIRRTCKHTKH
ncbi:hypothetical protein BDV25DRAFT_150415 [Aspergillus avenaceus]|uniref:Dickkopf N-terminal cysteine-rich domain-containing protein n=1 Tax=Aspergillus avenaceus TaxID=36643 RepID=A0A5N6U2J6_ASPAV|nr:hypothetical protein BDV25DRAFT_150415 [Aspergillus avenaceus]